MNPAAAGGTLSRFPKRRPPLPPEFKAIYERQYKENRTGKTPAYSLAQRMESWLHRRVAADVVAERSPKSTLEIGAGTLNQLPYEPVVGPYDIVEPFRNLYEGSPLLPRVRNIFADITDVPADSRYDRITSIAAFEHVCNLPEVVARTGLLLDVDGTLRVSIPSEGTVLWTLGWKMTTGLEFRVRYGLDYGVLMRHEHVNTAREIEDVLTYFFARVRTAVFGLSKRISFYRFHECSEPRREECANYVRPRS